VRIAFPGSGNLNTIQQIRRDGRISLPLVGDFKAAGMTPSNLEKELVKLIGIWFLARRAYSALRG
jgi:protein involved in polysaccharide export with SLBB domain